MTLRQMFWDQSTTIITKYYGINSIGDLTSEQYEEAMLLMMDLFPQELEAMGW